MTDDEFIVVEEMQEHGGSFVKALADCFHKADNNNFMILKNAFKGYWLEYEARVKNK